MRRRVKYIRGAAHGVGDVDAVAAVERYKTLDASFGGTREGQVRR